MSKGAQFVYFWEPLKPDSSLNIKINSRLINRSSGSIRLYCCKVLEKRLLKAPAPLCTQRVSPNIISQSQRHRHKCAYNLHPWAVSCNVRVDFSGLCSGHVAHSVQSWKSISNLVLALRHDTVQPEQQLCHSGLRSTDELAVCFALSEL